MSDEVNEKTIALCVNGGKMTVRALRIAMVEWLRHMDRSKNRSKTVRSYGKQSMKKLYRQNVELTNIEITEGNIKSFERYARKYGIDYSLKKDKAADPPRWYVFFKAKDVDTMKAAFKEYTQDALNREKKPSVRKKLTKMMEVAQKMNREKTKQKSKSQEAVR